MSHTPETTTPQLADVCDHGPASPERCLECLTEHVQSLSDWGQEMEDKLEEALDEAADDKEEIQFLKQALEDLIDAVESAAHDASSAMTSAKENRRR